MRWLIFCLALLPLSAEAGAWSRGCSFTGGTVAGTLGTPADTGKEIRPGGVGCYRFINADGVHNSTATAHGSVVIHVTAYSALISFDPQLDAVVGGPTAAMVIPHYCPLPPLTIANPEQSCIGMGGANGNVALTGVEGTASSQNAAIRVGPGWYYFEVSGACVAGDTCQVLVQGEGSLD